MSVSNGSGMPDPKTMWEQRYGDDAYVYGTEPNDFLRASVADLAPGRALCIADGEGRNGVFLASRGFDVTSMDLSEAGMAKARRLAEGRGVSVTTIVSNVDEFDLGSGAWDLIVLIFAHVPPPIRGRLHGRIANALAPGGLLVLEAYTPDQVGRGTGGPPVPEMAMTLEGLRSELVGMHIEHGVEMVRPVIEGTGHTGDGAVVQVIARAEP